MALSFRFWSIFPSQAGLLEKAEPETFGILFSMQNNVMSRKLIQA